MGRLPAASTKRLFAATWLLATQVGCDDGRAERAERQEFAALTMAIAAVRDADNAHKSAPLAALRKIRCDRACELQRVCVQAYEAHLAVIRQLASELRDQEASAGLARLGQLRSHLQQASLAVSHCTDAEFEQRARLRMP